MPSHPPQDCGRSLVSTSREAYYSAVRDHASQCAEADPSAAEALVHLIYTSDMVETRIARSLSSHGISTAAFNVLMILLNSEGNARSLHELSDLLIVSRANVTGLVDCLEHRGLVEREIDPRDRRVRIARLLPDGRALTDEILPEHHRTLRSLCGDLSETERSTLVELLRRLRASVEEAAP